MANGDTNGLNMGERNLRIIILLCVMLMVAVRSGSSSVYVSPDGNIRAYSEEDVANATLEQLWQDYDKSPFYVSLDNSTPQGLTEFSMEFTVHNTFPKLVQLSKFNSTINGVRILIKDWYFQYHLEGENYVSEDNTTFDCFMDYEGLNVSKMACCNEANPAENYTCFGLANLSHSRLVNKSDYVAYWREPSESETLGLMEFAKLKYVYNRELQSPLYVDSVPFVGVPEPAVSIGEAEVFNYNWTWWNVSYAKQRSMSVNYSASTFSDYPLQVYIENWSGMESDFRSLRFVNSSNKELSYYINNITITNGWLNASVYVSIPYISASTLYNITIVWNNSLVSSTSNGFLTFDFFEDFNDGVMNLSKWYNCTSTICLEQNGVLNLTGNPQIQNGLRSIYPIRNMSDHTMLCSRLSTVSVTDGNMQIYMTKNFTSTTYVCGIGAIPTALWGANYSLIVKSGNGNWNQSMYNWVFFNNNWTRVCMTAINQTHVRGFIGDRTLTLVANITDSTGDNTQASSLTLGAWGTNGWKMYDEIYVMKTLYPNPEPAVSLGEIKDFATYPNVTFVSQLPSDLTTFNAFGSGLNATFAALDENSIAFVNLSYNVNTTTQNWWMIVNGTNITGDYVNITQSGFAGDNYTFHMDDNDIYPATYNYPEESMEQTPHTYVSLTAPTDILKVRFFNVSNTAQYGIFEFMAANQSLSSNILHIYYCNASYSSGAPSTAPECVDFYDLDVTQKFNHTHSAYSSHYTVSFAINTTDNTINGVRVTDTSYFIFNMPIVSAGNGWNIHYINAVSRPDTVQSSVNGGSSYSNLVGTVDSHLHQYTGSEVLWYFACATNLVGMTNCSGVRGDSFNLTNMPPTAPEVSSPLNTAYYKNSLVNITYSPANSPSGNAIIFYNITLANLIGGYVSTINTNNSLNLSMEWNISGVAVGTYLVRVSACDNVSLCSAGFSMNFTLVDPVAVSGSNCRTDNIYVLTGTTFDVRYDVIQGTSNLSKYMVYFNNAEYGNQSATTGVNNFTVNASVLGAGAFLIACNVTDEGDHRSYNIDGTITVVSPVTTTLTTVTTISTSTTTTTIQYEAILVNMTVSPRVYLNDYVSGYVQIVNTMNMTLSKQDCNVIALDNDTDMLVKSFDTTCTMGQSYIDLNGNWAMLTSNCTLSDSLGFYYFKGLVLESDGFQTGKNYKLRFICNLKTADGTFYVDVPKPADVDKWFGYFRRYGGIIMLWVFAGIGILIFGGLMWQSLFGH